MKEAVFGMDGVKSPGPDGFSMLLYQECWDTIKEDLMKVVREFHERGEMNKSMTSNFIVLIPKKKGAQDLGAFRPISLVSSLYKIISKMLPFRLRMVMELVVASTQSAFIKGRQIIDSILIANECVNFRRRANESGVVCKLDMENAYDRVDWEFLRWVLKMKGFGVRWCNWMKGCMESPYFFILINETSKGFFKSSRGLRQGDPLSPFLFSLVADGLPAILKQAERHGLIEGFEVGDDRVMVSHLQFADDTILFLNATWETVRIAERCLEIFGLISGFKVNLNKSVLVGVNVDNGLLRKLASHMGYTMGSWPLNYLGMALGGNPRSIMHWDVVVERVSKKLAAWKKNYISLGGRITLIKSSLANIPVYYMLVFRMPPRVVKTEILVPLS